MKKILLAALLVAQPLPALAADLPLTGLMRVTEVSPSGAAFQFWSHSDVVGLHSRLRVEVALTADELRQRVEALEAGTVPDDDDVIDAMNAMDRRESAMALLIDQQAHQARPAPAVGPVRLTDALRKALVARAERQTRYRVVVRARLQPSTSGGWVALGRRHDTADDIDLTAEDAPAAWVVQHAGGELPLALRTAWPRLGPNGRLAEALQRLEASGKSPALVATCRQVIAELKALEPLMALADDQATTTHVPGYIPEQVVLDLDTLSTRRAGDHVELQLVLQREGEDVAVLEERTAVLHKVGLYPDAKLGVTFTSLGTWSPALTLVAKWGYRTGFTASNTEMFGPQLRLRGLMSGGALMWNEVWDPGIALNLSGQGVGVGLSFFKELLQVGRGYNPQANDFYWYGGLGLPISLFDVVQQ